MSLLRTSTLALLITTVAAPLAARDPQPASQGVDVVSGAGKVELPPKKEPSIDMSGAKSKVKWDPHWRKFELFDYVATGIMVAGSFGVLAIPPKEDRWLKVNSFDESVRNALMADGFESQERARDASDILLYISLNQVLVDTLIVTWWGHDAGNVAYEMALMNIEALTFNTAINGLVSGLASRQRPYAADRCVGEDATELKDCRNNKRYRSFFSGHTSTTFAIAGLTCMHHSYLPLYGGGVPDVLICISSFGVAAATGALRVVGDQHFATDVITGALFGTASGTLIPWLLHYRNHDLPEAPKKDAVSFQLVPTLTGAYLTGAF